MNAYQISDVEFEPILMLTDHHERAISQFQLALAEGMLSLSGHLYWTVRTAASKRRREHNTQPLALLHGNRW